MAVTGDGFTEELVADLVALEETVESLQNRVDDLEAENDRLRERVAELDARTDLLQLVEDAEDMTAEQRSVSILQHMHRKIQRSDREKVALTRDQVAECLHHPPLDRSTFYSDMRRCERLVGDDDVCFYAGDGVGTRDEAAIVLDLGGGELPAQYRAGGDQR